jgi:hypothetical protein
MEVRTPTWFSTKPKIGRIAVVIPMNVEDACTRVLRDLEIE